MTDSPLHALRQTILNLRAKSDKRVTLATIPRALALRVIGDYAAEQQKTLEPDHMRALANMRQKELLLIIDGVPVIAGPMLVPMFAAWTWPVPQALSEVEENSTYPGFPWYPGLEDKPEIEMMNWVRQAVRQARELIEKRPARYFEPATAYMSEGWENEGHDDGIKREPLSEDQAIAWEQFKDSVRERESAIRAEMDSPQGFGFGIRGTPEFIERVKEHMAETFDAHVELASQGDLTVVHLSRRRILN